MSQIILHKSGCDPDFRATKRFHIDVEPLIEQLVEKAQMEDAGRNAGMKAELEEALTQKQESEAKLAHAMAQISQLEEAVRNGGGSPSKLAVPPGLVLRGPPGAPPPPGGAGPPPPPGAGAPPPPPPPGGAGPPPPPPGLHGAATPRPGRLRCLMGAHA